MSEGLEFVTKGVNRKSTLAREWQARRRGAASESQTSVPEDRGLPMPTLGIGRVALYETNPDWRDYQEVFGTLNRSEGTTMFTSEMMMLYVGPDEVTQALQTRFKHPITEVEKLTKACNSIGKTVNKWLLTQRDVSTERSRYRKFTHRYGVPELEQLIGSADAETPRLKNVATTQLLDGIEEYWNPFEGVTLNRQEEIKYSFVGFDRRYYGVSFDDFSRAMQTERDMVVNMLREEIGPARYLIGKQRWQPRMRTFEIEEGTRLGQQRFRFPTRVEMPLQTVMTGVRIFSEGDQA